VSDVVPSTEGQVPEVPETPEDESSTFGRRAVLGIGVFAIGALALREVRKEKSPAAAGQVPQLGIGSTPTSAAPKVQSDATLLRTLTSVLQATVQAHQGVLASGMVKTPELVSALQTFVRQDQDHVQRLSQLTTRSNGQPYTDPNPLVMSRTVTPGLKAIKDENTALTLSQSAEGVLSDSFQLFMPMLSSSALRMEVMQVGAVFARHAAYLATKLSQGVIVTVTESAIPAGVTTTTTTTIPGTVAPDPVYAVTGPFGNSANGVGPSYYV
jgi:hypothetical protein